MVTEQEMEELKLLAWPWDHLNQIQWTKPPDVVKRTTELLAKVGHDVEGKQLRGQCVCIMSVVVYLLLCAIYNVQLELIEFLFSS